MAGVYPWLPTRRAFRSVVRMRTRTWLSENLEVIISYVVNKAACMHFPCLKLVLHVTEECTSKFLMREAGTGLFKSNAVRFRWSRVHRGFVWTSTT
jgi:hypothetical protein